MGVPKPVIAVLLSPHVSCNRARLRRMFYEANQPGRGNAFLVHFKRIPGVSDLAPGSAFDLALPLYCLYALRRRVLVTTRRS